LPLTSFARVSLAGTLVWRFRLPASFRNAISIDYMFNRLIPPMYLAFRFRYHIAVPFYPVTIAVGINRARFIGRHTGVAILHSEIISQCNFNRLIVGICSIKLSITC
jgi:hypothetical protein